LNMSKPSQPMLGKFLLNWCHPTLSRIALFRTLSLLVCPQNHCNIRISATLACCLFVGQHSAPYKHHRANCCPIKLAF
jgi:hypothetical protein